MSAAAGERGDDLCSCSPGRFVLPYANNAPTRVRERTVHLSIAIRVPPKLRLPVVGVGTRNIAVLRAPMPEAPVDEDRYPTTREDHINANQAPRRQAHGVVDPEAEADAVQRRTQRDLRSRVALPIPFHDSRRCSRRRLRIARCVGVHAYGLALGETRRA